MPTFQLKRGTADKVAAFVGKEGEIVYNKDTKAIHLMDGVTAGGEEVGSRNSILNKLNESDVVLGTNLVPEEDNTYTLGTIDKVWKDVFVGPGSLYVNGKKVIEDDSDTIVFRTDADQNLRVATSGSGDLELMTGVSGKIEFKSSVQIAAGKNITSSDGTGVSFGDPIDMNNNKIVNLVAPTSNLDAATKQYVDVEISTAITDLKGGASAAYDTLLEIESFVKSNDTDIATILSDLSLKAPTPSSTTGVSEVLAWDGSAFVNKAFSSLGGATESYATGKAVAFSIVFS